MGGRFEGIAQGLAHNELAMFGSFLGFDSEFEQGLHDQISPHHERCRRDHTYSSHHPCPWRYAAP